MDPTIEIQVHNLKAKVLLNRPITDLIPDRYLQRVDRSYKHILTHKLWIFRTTQDGRRIDLTKWTKLDIRYRGVFKTLQKVPPFPKSLYEDGCSVEDVKLGEELFANVSRAQGQVVYALLYEVLDMMDLTREAGSKKEWFCLRPRLVNCQMEYLTGHQQERKYKDGPGTAGMLSLDFCPSRRRMECIVPISTTMENQPLESALQGKFKLILSQLLTNIRRLRPPGPNLPDQEVFLIGLHGSRLHIFRGLFPGKQISKMWYGKGTKESSPTGRGYRRRCFSSPSTVSSSASVASSSSSSPLSCTVKGHPVHIINDHNDNNIPQYTKEGKSTYNTTIPTSNEDEEKDQEPFTILASHEYDLWQKPSFQAAVRALVALITYLMSGRAQCGVLQHTFECYPYHEEVNSNTDNNNININISPEPEKDHATRLKRITEENHQQQLETLTQREQEEGRRRKTVNEILNNVPVPVPVPSLREEKIGVGVGGGFGTGFKKQWWEFVGDDHSNHTPTGGGTDLFGS